MGICICNNKLLLQEEVREEIYKHEEKITNEIKQKSNTNKRIWTHINKLRRKKVKERDKIVIYNQEGKALFDNEAKYEVETFWSCVYRKHIKDVPKVWDPNIKRQYIDKDEQASRKSQIQEV